MSRAALQSVLAARSPTTVSAAAVSCTRLFSAETKSATTPVGADAATISTSQPPEQQQQQQQPVEYTITASPVMINPPNQKLTALPPVENPSDANDDFWPAPPFNPPHIPGLHTTNAIRSKATALANQRLGASAYNPIVRANIHATRAAVGSAAPTNTNASVFAPKTVTPLPHPDPSKLYMSEDSSLSAEGTASADSIAPVPQQLLYDNDVHGRRHYAAIIALNNDVVEMQLANRAKRNIFTRIYDVYRIPAGWYSSASRIYMLCKERTDDPEVFATFGIDNTPRGQHAVMCLHVWLIAHALRFRPINEKKVFLEGLYQHLGYYQEGMLRALGVRKAKDVHYYTKDLLETARGFMIAMDKAMYASVGGDHELLYGALYRNVYRFSQVASLEPVLYVEYSHVNAIFSMDVCFVIDCLSISC